MILLSLKEERDQNNNSNTMVHIEAHQEKTMNNNYKTFIESKDK